MNEHAQRVAIAKWVGWRPRDEGAGSWYMPPPDGGTVSWKLVPDYTRDLNAMHMAEAQLGSMNERLHYMDSLRTVVGLGDDEVKHFAVEVAKLIHATAAQRAEALLRTLNLWADDTPSSP
jgi:hypothetical protein